MGIRQRTQNSENEEEMNQCSMSQLWFQNRSVCEEIWDSRIFRKSEIWEISRILEILVTKAKYSGSRMTQGHELSQEISIVENCLKSSLKD